jgi:hypothetical protein
MYQGIKKKMATKRSLLTRTSKKQRMTAAAAHGGGVMEAEEGALLAEDLKNVGHQAGVPESSMVRAKNEEELTHAKSMLAMKIAASDRDQIDRYEKLKFETEKLKIAEGLVDCEARRQKQILSHENALIQCLERSIKLEHDKQMATNDAYRIATFEQAALAAAAEKEAAEAKELQRVKDAEAKAIQRVKDAEAKEIQRPAEALQRAKDAEAKEIQRAETKANADAKAAANAVRARKASETRIAKAADAKLKLAIQECKAAKPGHWLRLLEIDLDVLLKEKMPDAVIRAAYIHSIGPEANTSVVYVIGFKGLPFSRYVGVSDNIVACIEQHRNGKGATCLKGAVDIELLSLTSIPTGMNHDSHVRAMTIDEMFTHGVDNVRGWHFRCPNALLPSLRAEAIKNICHRRELCMSCGHDGHFSDRCDYNISEWMRN